MKNFFGITLIELMISIILSMFILSSVTAIYLAIQKSLNSQSALMNIQENIQVVVELLSSSIRTAGYIGCAKLSGDFPILAYPPFIITEDNRVTSYKNSEIKKGSDAISVIYASVSKSRLVKNMREQNILYISSETRFSKGDILLVSDCVTAEIFTVKEVSTNKDNIQFIETERPLNKYYSENSELSFFESNKYYIGETGRQDSKGFPIYALYMKDIALHKTELVENLIDMKVSYDLLEDKQLVAHTSNEINDWSKVVGVSIMLKFSSMNPFPMEKSIYTYVALREI